MKNLRTIEIRQLSAQMRWSAYAAMRRLGTLGMLAGGIGGALLALEIMVLKPQKAELAETRSAHVALLAKLPKAGKNVRNHGMSLREVQKFELGERAYFVLDTLSQQGMERKSTTYRHESVAKGQLRRLHINVAMTGTYAQLRQALRIIANQPMARVESLTIDRKDIDRSEINVNLHVSLLGADT